MVEIKSKTTFLLFCLLLFSLLARSVPGQQPTQAETHKRIRLWQLYYKLQDGTTLTSDEKKLFLEYHNDPDKIYYELHGIYPKSPIFPPTPTPPKQPTRDELLSQIQDLKDAIATLEREVVRYQRWIAKLKHTIAERDQEISDLKLKLSRSEQRGTPSARKPIAQAPSSTPSQPQDVLSCLPKKTCADILSCDEAYYRFNVCGHKELDPDKNGIPCEDICQEQRQNPSESQKTTPTSGIHEKDAEFLKSLDAWDITESQRKQIFTELVLADDKALTESAQKYPDDGKALADNYDSLLKQYEAGIARKYNLTDAQLWKIKQEGSIKDWIDQFPEPTPAPTVKAEPDKIKMQVGADNAIKDYIVETYGFSRKHIKIGSWLQITEELITVHDDGSFNYVNTIKYKNAFGADMESKFVASCEYLGEYNVKLLEIQFQ